MTNPPGSAELENVAERPSTVSVKVVDVPRPSLSKSKMVEAFAAAHKSTIGRSSFSDLLKIMSEFLRHSVIRRFENNSLMRRQLFSAQVGSCALAPVFTVRWRIAISASSIYDR